jgi:hypothetical protein
MPKKKKKKKKSKKGAGNQNNSNGHKSKALSFAASLAQNANLSNQLAFLPYFKPESDATSIEGRISLRAHDLRQILIYLINEARTLLGTYAPPEFQAINAHSMLLVNEYGIGNCGEHAFYAMQQILSELDPNNASGITIKDINQVTLLAFADAEHNHSHSFIIIFPNMLHNRINERSQGMTAEKSLQSFKDSPYGQCLTSNIPEFVAKICEETQSWEQNKKPIIVDLFHGVVAPINNMPENWIDRYSTPEKLAMRLDQSFYNCLYEVGHLRRIYLRNYAMLNDHLKTHGDFQREHTALKSLVTLFKNAEQTFFSVTNTQNEAPLEKLEEDFIKLHDRVQQRINRSPSSAVGGKLSAPHIMKKGFFATAENRSAPSAGASNEELDMAAQSASGKKGPKSKP